MLWSFTKWWWPAECWFNLPCTICVQIWPKFHGRSNIRSLSLSHYSDVIMDTMASQITSLTIVYSAFYSGAYLRKSSASLAFVQRIHRWPVNSPHKWPGTGKMFPFDDVIVIEHLTRNLILIMFIIDFKYVKLSKLNCDLVYGDFSDLWIFLTCMHWFVLSHFAERIS